MSYSPPPLLVVGDILLEINDNKMCFTRLVFQTGQTQEKWEISLDFTIWSVAMHPPMNVVAVSEYTSDLYVAFERFFNPDLMTLRISMHA